ncbi:Uncharacterised protein [Vibrio cholerae]|uniref:Uncharacterized protein n=1 Tax=Vibrio cholerae TaxID=666 RepID=A0A655T0S2_VIBCL|nr:Uncharacterised protein [Vibrio cholerae]CSB11440.1 Uncharacterised protein [Vibrio cholerae]CSB18509.1 Uncharacterised protein [Vibrio cholerae]CSB29692.1 Uncharacterised protein [Vibrio cholerae]CSB41700.1 Uncharacterised protein [Vibrio cholerae]
MGAAQSHSLSMLMVIHSLVIYLPLEVVWGSKANLGANNISQMVLSKGFNCVDNDCFSVNRKFHVPIVQIHRI